MVVLGLDIASSTGLALIDTARPAEEWRCLAIEAEGETFEEKADDFSRALFNILGSELPDFAAIEMPLRNVMPQRRVGNDLAGPRQEMTVNAGTALLLNQLAGAAVAVLCMLQVPFGMVAVATWRKAYYGTGFVPPRPTKLDKATGLRAEVEGADWKRAAINHARAQRIFLPATVKAQRDAAEAVGVATAWAKCTQVPARHKAAFKALRQGPPATPSLFPEARP